MPEIHIVVLGAGMVGKSCLTIQYIQGHFVDRYDSTIEDVYRKPTDVDGTSYVLTIVDTAGQDAFSTMRENYMKSGQGFVLVYSITDSESFQQLKKMYVQLNRARGDSASTACIVVGNKSDLSGQRAVSYDEGDMFAKQVKCPFREICPHNPLLLLLLNPRHRFGRQCNPLLRNQRKGLLVWRFESVVAFCF
jgi:GTPase KRas protein